MTSPSTGQPCLEVRVLRKAFGAQRVLEDVSFDVRGGTVLALLGASGAGKTTLLRILAGLEHADAGEITLAGRGVTTLPAEARGAVCLSQEPLLFPHLDVFENIAFGLRVRGASTSAIRDEVESWLHALDLDGFAHRRPETLSGGQRQRVAFARALVVKPALLLLDEPFSSLDPATRAAMQSLFLRSVRPHAIGTVFVTHDLGEALRVGDTFARLDGGRLTTYAERASFCADPRNGVAQEVAFWQQVAGLEEPDPRP